MSHEAPAQPVETPYLGQTFLENARYDIVAGFLVFLIALPLCLGISIASGYPAVAGIFTAIIGGILVPLYSNSELTIKGPAAGMIAIVVGCVIEFNGVFQEMAVVDQIPAERVRAPKDAPAGEGFKEGSKVEVEHEGTWYAGTVQNSEGAALSVKYVKADASLPYRWALGVGVVAGLVQIGFALFRVGALGEFFPTAVVHGMLAAIGVIIILKQIPVMLGVKPEATEMIHLILEYPNILSHANGVILLIGSISLLIMVTWAVLGFSWMKIVPAALVVLLVAVPIGLYFGLDDSKGHLAIVNWPNGEKLGEFMVSDKFLVNVPANLLKAIAFPDFSQVFTLIGIKYVVMFSLVGTLESLLSARAIDSIDPWKRQTDLNRDLLMIGIANTLASLVGGLPMISEIVRSKANSDAGARSRWANAFHGFFLLLFLVIAPALIHEIPMAALAAMLVFTGFRLASPHEFYKTFLIGPEQLVVFCTTLIVTLLTDLLIGVAAGIAVKFCFHLYHGVPIRSLFLPYLDVTDQKDGSYLVEAKDSAVFSNWVLLKAHLVKLGIEGRANVTIDLSNTVFVDHTVMENLHVLEQDFEKVGQKLTIVGFDEHQPLSTHELSARRRVKVGS